MIRHRPLLVAVLLGLGFAALYAGISRGTFVFGDDILMYQVTEAIWERHEVSVSSPVWRGDVAKSIPGVDGGHYAKYGIGQSLVALPFYARSAERFRGYQLPVTADRVGNLRYGPTVFGTGLTNAATGGATVAVAYLLAVEVGFASGVALAVAALLGAGTLLPHYASTFLSEPLAAFALALGALGLARADRRARSSGGWDPGGLLLSGFGFGLAVATKVAHIVIVGPFALWAFLVVREAPRGRRLLALTAWATPFAGWLAVVAAYNRARFGGIFETGYGWESRGFTTPLSEGLTGLLASPAKGVLWYCPVLLLAIVGLRGLHARRPGLLAAMLAASLAHVALMAKYYQWWGGDCWGPRFLVPLLPLWLLPAGVVLERWGRSPVAARGAIVVVIVASLVTAAAPSLIPFDAIEDRVTGTRESMAEGAWSAARSPLVRHVDLLPGASRVAVRKLAGLDPVVGVRVGDPPIEVPDWAFVKYGSHRLLTWTRRCFGFALLFGGLAGVTAWRGQKAFWSSPPQ